MSSDHMLEAKKKKKKIDSRQTIIVYTLIQSTKHVVLW